MALIVLISGYDYDTRVPNLDGIGAKQPAAPH